MKFLSQFKFSAFLIFVFAHLTPWAQADVQGRSWIWQCSREEGDFGWGRVVGDRFFRSEDSVNYLSIYAGDSPDHYRVVHRIEDHNADIQAVIEEWDAQIFRNDTYWIFVARDAKHNLSIRKDNRGRFGDEDRNYFRWKCPLVHSKLP